MASSAGHERLSAKNEGGALEGVALTEHQGRLKLESNLRDALASKDSKRINQAFDDVTQAVAGPHAYITAAQAKSLEKDALLTPLQAGVKKLPLNDAFDVWEATGIEERKAQAVSGETLRDIMDAKIKSFWKFYRSGKIPPREAKAMFDIVNQFMAETAPDWEPIDPNTVPIETDEE